MATCVGFRILLAGLFICAATEAGAAAGLFTPTGDMSVERVNHTATLLSDGTVLIAGGSTFGGATNSAERYNPALGTFSPTGNMNETRYGHTATLLVNGKVLIAGGFGTDIASAEIYDPATGTFSPTGSMVVSRLVGSPPLQDSTVGRYFHTATRLADGRVLLVGGTPGPFDAEIYDPATGMFSAVGGNCRAMPDGSTECGLTAPRQHHTATLLDNGTVLVLGGFANHFQFSRSGVLPDAEIFDPSNGTFHAIANMTTPRMSHTATRLSNGTVLVAGGENDGGISGTAGILGTAETYDPATSSFSAGQPMQMARRLFTATLLSNGQVLVAGGVVCASGQSCNVLYTASAELYDPVSGAFSPTGSMTLARSEHTATLLANGSVLVTGGDNFGPHATAELFGFQPPPFVVNTTDDGDDGQCNGAHCSLREAINAANADADASTINFNIPGTGVHTIQPGSALPLITHPVLIDGYSQPGAQENTLAAGNDAVLLIELDGTNAGSPVTGLTIAGTNSTVQGLVINRFSESGISLGGSGGGNTVRGNYLGVNAAGTAAQGNAIYGVGVLNGANNTIGGTAPGDRNVISGNGSNGVQIDGPIGHDNLVRGNLIGTDATGTVDLGNMQSGIAVLAEAHDNQIGGTTAGARNIISGNSGFGVRIGDDNTSNNTVQGNYIGTDINGTATLGNGVEGIIIGGDVGTTGNTVGGVGAGAGNIIANNGQPGITVTGSGAINNAIRGNSIYDNQGIGIDLGANGVTANDAGDTDGGANNLQNFPVITSASLVSGTRTINGTLNSTPVQSFNIDFYSNATCDTSGNGEGQIYLGSLATGATDGNGDVSFTFHPATLSVRQFVTATATDSNGNTSEFSQCVTVSGTADLSITKTASVNPAEVGRIFTYNIAVSNAGPDAANAVTVTDALPAGVTFTSATPSQGSCAFASGTVTCQLGSLALNGSASIALQVKPRQTGTLMNTASVTAAEPDTDTSNNSDTSSINVIKTVDLKVSKTDSADPIFVGQQTTYTMLVTNLGTISGATGIVLTDSLPSSMTFVSATTTQGSLVTPPVGSNGIVTANLGSLAVGAQATVTVTVKATQSGGIVNTATVSSNETDTNTSNNTATQATTVKDAALQKVLLTKQVLTGGCENTTGNVYLTGPAPPGGVTVPLSSNISGASVPASVFIPAGQTVSPAFNVTTHPVAAKQVGLITAGSGAGSVSRGIIINVGGGSCP
jgi:uncharacterized repeat protein (TIGR01451 family)/CSLREA domain-containing protein